MHADRIRLSVGFCFSLALLFLVLPLPWILSIAVAATIHEIFHLLAIRLLAGTSSQCRVGIFRANIPLPEMTVAREFVCAIAGPVGSLSLLLLAKWFPRVALCGALQAAFNLLPIYPLDGGRALQSLLRLLFRPPVSNAISVNIGIICKMVLVILGVYGCIWLRFGIFPLLMVAVLLLRTK